MEFGWLSNFGFKHLKEDSTVKRQITVDVTTTTAVDQGAALL